MCVFFIFTVLYMILQFVTCLYFIRIMIFFLCVFCFKRNFIFFSLIFLFWYMSWFFFFLAVYFICCFCFTIYCFFLVALLLLKLFQYALNPRKKQARRTDNTTPKTENLTDSLVDFRNEKRSESK